MTRPLPASTRLVFDAHQAGGYTAVVMAAHAGASAALLQLLLRQQDLLSWLRSLKHFFLLDQVRRMPALRQRHLDDVRTSTRGRWCRRRDVPCFAACGLTAWPGRVTCLGRVACVCVAASSCVCAGRRGGAPAGGGQGRAGGAGAANQPAPPAVAAGARRAHVEPGAGEASPHQTAPRRLLSCRLGRECPPSNLGLWAQTARVDACISLCAPRRSQSSTTRRVCGAFVWWVIVCACPAGPARRRAAAGAGAAQSARLGARRRAGAPPRRRHERRSACAHAMREARGGPRGIRRNLGR